MPARTAALPPVDLADPIWTVEHLALALRLGERATRDAVAGPGFPPGFRLSLAPTARRYWLREHVLQHFASLSTARRARPAPARRTPPPRQRRPVTRDEAALEQIAALPTRAGHGR